MCTFDFDVITQFLAEVLSIIEEEKYEATNIELENGITTIIPIGSIIIPIRNTFDESVCLISTIQNIREISELYDNEYIDDSDDIKNSIENGKFILLELDDEYCLFDYSKQQVPEEITEKYPYLSEIICDLISIKLSNPNLTDNQAISIMIQEIPKRYSHLIGNSKRFFSLTKNPKKQK